MIESSLAPGCAGVNEAASLSPEFRSPYLCVSVPTQPLLERSDAAQLIPEAAR